MNLSNSTHQSLTEPGPKSSLLVTLVDKIQVSANVMRLTFTDPSGALSETNESYYTKFTFHKPDGDTATRSFTIVEVDSTNHTFSIDCINRHDSGLASRWFADAKAGDTVTINKPKPVMLADARRDWYFFAGDLTALPTMSVMLKRLAKTAKGYALIAVNDAADKRTLIAPDEFDIEWVVESDQYLMPDTMLSVAKSRMWLDGEPFVWAAGEFAMARKLQQYFRDGKTTKKNSYFSSYWKVGETDEGNKKAKKADGGF